MYGMLLGYGYVAASAFLFGTVAIITKYAYDLGITVKQLILVQGIFSSLVIWLGIFIFCPHQAKVKKKDGWFLLVQGIVGSGMSTIAFFYALQYLTASLASVLFFTYPIAVVVLSMTFFQERITVVRWCTLFLAFIGSVMALGLSNAHPGLSYNLGVILALAAGFFYALANILAQRNLKENHPVTVTAYTVLFSNICFFIFSWPIGPNLVVMDGRQWLVAGSISLVSTIFPLIFYFYGAQLIGVSRASIVSTLELPLTVVLAWVILRETMGLQQMVGSVLILVAVLGLQVEQRFIQRFQAYSKRL